MAQQRDSTGQDDIGALIDQAVNGTANPAPANASTAPTAASPQGGQDPGTDILNMVQAAKGPIAKVETISKPTVSQRDPLTGLSSSSANPNTVYRYYWADGSYLDVSSPAGHPSAVIGGSALKALAPTKASTATVGTNTKDPYIVQMGPDGKTVTQPNPNYVAPKEADKPFTIPDDANPGQTKAVTWQDYNAYMTAKNKADANQNVQDHNAVIAAQQLKDANDRANAANARTDLGYYQANLQNQVDQGKLSEQQAMDLFKQKYDMMTFEQTQQQNAQAQRQGAFAEQNTMLQSGIAAGNQAMDAAQRGTVNAVGPDFGAHYAASLSAASQGNPAGVHFGAGDFTTPMPNYQQMATQGAAAAIAHLSPYAASLVGQPGMQQYQGAGSAPIQPAVAASQYVPPNNEATASQTQRMMTMPIPPYQPVNRAVGANAQIQAGLR